MILVTALFVQVQAPADVIAERAIVGARAAGLQMAGSAMTSPTVEGHAVVSCV